MKMERENVILAQARIHSECRGCSKIADIVWIPAFAGMTGRVAVNIILAQARIYSRFRIGALEGDLQFKMGGTPSWS